MTRLAAVTALKALLPLAALLPLVGCASSPGAWAYYDRRYDNGWEGYERPISYSGTSYGEAAYGRPYGSLPSTPEPQYSERTYDEMPDYAGELNASSRPRHRCNCIQAHPESGKSSSKAAAQDPDWNSTYYSIGP